MHLNGITLLQGAAALGTGALASTSAYRLIQAAAIDDQTGAVSREVGRTPEYIIEQSIKPSAGTLTTGIAVGGGILGVAGTALAHDIVSGASDATRGAGKFRVARGFAGAVMTAAAAAGVAGAYMALGRYDGSKAIPNRTGLG